MSAITLSLAMGDYDRTRAIFDGRVRIEGVNPSCILLSPEEMFFRAFRQSAFDISELSLSSYCISIARSNPEYIAIPVFLSRAFRHTSVYVRKDRGIRDAALLRGRRVGIAEYQLTANVWLRGILQDRYGVKPSEIIWVRGGMNEPGRPEKINVELPQDLTVIPAPAGATLNEMLACGDIDAFIGPRSPKCFDEGDPNISRLFADTISEAEDYYRDTKIFPIMHVVGIRRSLAATHPWLPASLFKAFASAKKVAEDALLDTSANKVTLPFIEELVGRTRALMGSDAWTYGVESNHHVLETFLRYHHEQGLSPRRVQVDELFHPSSFETYSL
ncbi:ABC transporter substrate-binding protein [Rhizobium sp. WYJ-E13]|uniref:ABC transporter substrate-binding protein n=1 Tax=Rhizobium sp. WYJ-E13 TaxID=2849093 RepID=UPI001C1F1F3F|nr:ABC transporter substrate-binding protein [Rhizobium sp. WYJ-E13]QWW72380.1 ABC transporter substrate-binding protein [Rhizobium sp. WYJ-E13]